MIIEGQDWTDEEIRNYAVSERDLHDPAKQAGNTYNRCEHCHFTRHPCDVHLLALLTLSLLDWKVSP